MSNSFFNINKPVAHNGRSGFDLSSNHVFDMRPSVIRPVIVQPTVPNSSYRINCDDIVRTGALQTAAFLRGRQEIDFFFVPYSQIYSSANDIIFGRSDHHSPLLDQSTTEFPTFNLGNLVYCAGYPYIWNRLIRNLVAMNPDFAAGYKTMTLGYFITHIYNNHSMPDEMIISIGRQLYYNCFSVDQFLSQLVSIGCDSLHLLSTLKYGDYLNLCESCYLSYEGAIRELGYGTSLSEVLDGFKDLFFTIVDGQWVSLICNNISDFSPKSDEPNYGTVRRYVTLTRLAAYQKIFKDYFRDTINDDSPLYLYSSSTDFDFSLLYRKPFDYNGEDYDNYHLLLTLLHPRLRQFTKDLSTGIYNSAQFGDYVSEGTLHSMEDFVESTDPAANQVPGSALSIRFTLAMQRYRETLLRAGNRTKDLLMSEFGVQSNYINDTYVKHIGSFGGALQLNKVETTADSSEYHVGDLAGNVFSALQGDTIDFTCNDHGYIIGVMSFVSQPLHNAFGIDPFLFKSRQFDFFHEQFENLGLQPVSSSVFTSSVSDSYSQSNEPITIGFSARYNEYKQNIDMAHDSFTAAFPISGTDMPIIDGINSNYVTLRDTLQSISSIRERSYMLPNVMDTIFREVDTGLMDSYHFQVTLNCSISAVLPMSVIGLPTY